MTTLTALELIALLARNPKALVIDVSLAKDYQAEHLPGAKNAAVYEVSFLDQVEELLDEKINREGPVIVYGSSEGSMASATAAMKLEAAGFSDVHDFRGGLAEWKRGRHPLEGEGDHASAVNEEKDGTYQIDPEASQLEWTGRSLGGKHSGTLQMSTGEIEMRKGKLTGGRFTIDMTSMENTDIDDAGPRKILLDHLMGEDFFEVERFPTAVFDITGAEPIAGAAVSSPNLRVQGRLRLKGVEQMIEFEAVAGITEGGALAARANFDIDRTRWNVTYGSGKFYEKLGQHAVNDLITLDLKIVAR